MRLPRALVLTGTRSAGLWGAGLLAAGRLAAGRLAAGRLAAGLLAAGLLASGCAPATQSAPASSSAPASASATPSSSPTPAPTSTPTPTPRATPTPTPTPTYLSPLTGLPAEGPAPVLIVKLDNTTNALPHAGLSKADVVYLEEVEYGITRIAAVFSSNIPARIGPVRSARITDIDLLAQYRRPAFAYSGAQRKMFPVLDAAPFHDVSPRRGGNGYSRDYNRRAPYNYYLDGSIALSRAPKASEADNIGFVFDEQVPTGGLTATKATMKWGYASAQFDFSRRSGLYNVSLNGRRATSEEAKQGQRAATVVIQYVKQTPSAFFDKGGGNTPHAETIGTGKAVILRDGLAFDATWSRPSADEGTTYTGADGQAVPFKPGQQWIVLLDRKRPATITPLKEPVSETSSPSPSVVESDVAPRQ